MTEQTNPQTMTPKLWKVTRYVIEEYQTFGATRKEALDNLGAYGNPSNVMITKEICKPIKTFTPKP